MISLTAGDGHKLHAYQAKPDGDPKGGVVVLQEIFGVTAHVRRVTDGFAEAGYLTIAPALYDRFEPGIEVEYTDIQTGRDYKVASDVGKNLLDISAAGQAARAAGKVAVIGYCWGGGLAYLAACKLDIELAVAYYGGPISEHLDLSPNCPMMYHFGANDALIPLETVAAIRAVDTKGIYHIYENSGHGFNCDERDDYNPEDSVIALERTLEFLDKYL